MSVLHEFVLDTLLDATVLGVRVAIVQVMHESAAALLHVLPHSQAWLHAGRSREHAGKPPHHTAPPAGGLVEPCLACG